MKVTAWLKFSVWFVCLSARESQAGWQLHSKLWSVNTNWKKFIFFLGFGFFFNTNAELHHCKIWIPSLLASGGVIFSVYIWKNAFMFNINWCELCSHTVFFLTFTAELKRLCRIFWEFWEFFSIFQSNSPAFRITLKLTMGIQCLKNYDKVSSSDWRIMIKWTRSLIKRVFGALFLSLIFLSLAGIHKSR